MSYDITFKVRVANTNKYVPVGDCDANITWNVKEIIKLSTGLPWKNCANNGYVKDIIPSIEKGLRELVNYPQKYVQHESPNGWGTIEGTIHFFEWILKSWEDFCKYEDEEIVNVTTFWIE